jgi:hypothetical protein
MNQTYVINNNINSSMKKTQLKAKLNKLRQRTQLLLQNGSWKKYFNSPSDDLYLVSTTTQEEIFRNNLVESDEQKTILDINTKTSSKFNSLTKSNMLLTPIENYFLTNSHSHLNLLNETPIVKNVKSMYHFFFSSHSFI